VNRSQQPEVYRQRMYDFLLYPTAGQTQLLFFSLPQGQGLTSAVGGTAGTVKTVQDTNLEVPNMLPKPKSMLVESIEMYFEPGSVSTANTFTPRQPATAAAVAAVAVLLDGVNDVNQVGISGVLEFFVGSKLYLQEAPLKAFPPKARIEVDTAIGNSDTTTHNAVAVNMAHWGGRPYYLDPPITLESLQNWGVNCRWPAAVAMPSGFNARIGVALDGVIYRLSQ
jgi:hypothetical protein